MILVQALAAIAKISGLPMTKEDCETISQALMDLCDENGWEMAGTFTLEDVTDEDLEGYDA